MSQPDPSFLLSAGVAQTVQRVLGVAFVNKPCWFESHYRHTSLCSPGSWTRVSTSLRKHKVSIRLYKANAHRRWRQLFVMLLRVKYDMEQNRWLKVVYLHLQVKMYEWSQVGSTFNFKQGGGSSKHYSWKLRDHYEPFLPTVPTPWDHISQIISTRIWLLGEIHWGIKYKINIFSKFFKIL